MRMAVNCTRASRPAPLARAQRSLPSVLKSLLFVAGLLLCVYAGLLLMLWARQERIVFQPPGPPWEESDTVRVTYAAEDGQELFAYVVGRGPGGGGRSVEEQRSDSALRPPPATLLVFHGNAEIAAWSLPWAREVARRTGASVLLAEYRGYAGLAGRPTY